MSTQPKHLRTPAPYAAAALVALAVGLSACGGGSDDGGTAAVQGATGSGAAQVAVPGSGSSSSSSSSSSASTAPGKPVGGRQIRGDDPVAAASSRPKAQKGIRESEAKDSETARDMSVDLVHRACGLVSRARASSIVGRPIARVSEAPQGPTCVYQPSGGKQFVTLSVEKLNIRALTRKATIAKSQVGGHTAYCVKLGTMMMYVPLSEGRVLHITGSCAVAQQFASAALPKL